MVFEIKEYSSVEELEEKLEKEISNTKTTLGEYLRRLDDVRELAQKAKKIREVVAKLTGKKAINDDLGEITVEDLKIVLDAKPIEELEALETAVKSHQERLLALQRAREGLKPLDQLGEAGDIKYLVLENSGVPERILFKI
jgi:hypothetical protein